MHLSGFNLIKYQAILVPNGAGHLSLVIGHLSLVICHWSFVTGHLPLVIGHLLRVTDY
jgi:hypothetical protein